MAFAFQASSKVTVTPSREPLTPVSSPIFCSSALLFSRNTVMVTGVPDASTSVTAMTPLSPSHLATAENSLMLQAAAVPATPSARAAEADATPRTRAARAVVRRDMNEADEVDDLDKVATVPFTGCATAGGGRGLEAAAVPVATESPSGSQVYKRHVRPVNAYAGPHP